ncbi:UvrD-helicase domain-containing protein, partial [Brevibacterium paucivorans]|uniref:UvrD-helicase domain-containing protein n=1 Tax=Brevibacterium paucivorans TaxID=170994 RepID=UPI0011AF899A
LTGGAGTGKTVVLVHRAVRLAHGKGEGIYGQGSDAIGAGTPPRVVLTTFTSTLADSLVEQVQKLDPATPRAGELGQARRQQRRTVAARSDHVRRTAARTRQR